MENVDDLRHMLDNLSKEEIANIADTLFSKNKDRGTKKKAENPVIWAKRPATVILTVHCTHCNNHYTTIKHIRDNDLIFYSTNKDGTCAKTKLVAEKETWMDTYTKFCKSCTAFVKQLPLEELQERYIKLLSNTIRRV